MIYLKSVMFGIAGAIVVSVLWVLAAFVLPILIPQLLSRLGGGDGAGAAGARITSGSILVCRADRIRRGLLLEIQGPSARFTTEAQGFSPAGFAALKRAASLEKGNAL
jgi:hypothetical protein